VDELLQPPSGGLEVLMLDLADLASVRAGAVGGLSNRFASPALINNAGVMGTPAAASPTMLRAAIRHQPPGPLFRPHHGPCCPACWPSGAEPVVTSNLRRPVFRSASLR